ncbi:MAG: TetR/AcrR family transcriptional regulator [Candidatus Binatia bacterium]
MRDTVKQAATSTREPASTAAPPGSRKPAALRPTRERILDGAEALFAERGFSGTAMRDIARRVHLKPASIYSHFSGKQEIYEAVLERGLQPLSDLLEGLSGQDWSEQRLDGQMDALVEYLHARPLALRVILHEALAGGESLMRLAHDWLRPLFDAALATFRESGAGVLREEWQDDDLPMVIASLLYLILGHFAVPPALGEVFGDDPLSPVPLDRHTEFLRKIIPIVLFGNETPTIAKSRAGNPDPAPTGGEPGKK